MHMSPSIIYTSLTLEYLFILRIFFLCAMIQHEFEEERERSLCCRGTGHMVCSLSLIHEYSTSLHSNVPPENLDVFWKEKYTYA